MSRHAPWEKTFDKVVTPFEEFIHHESTSGLLLMACAVVALVLANTALHDTYEHILHAPIGFSIGGWQLEHSLHHWINDGLMWLFFFLVGLEIKREVLVGQLSDMRQAMLPIIAAIGGMVVPAGLYALINAGGTGISGWGVPMATDIAFAVGVLVMLGSRVPKSLLTFLVALAIVDDLGAVAVIAIFYTDTIVWEALGAALLLFGILVSFNRFGIRSPLPYFVVGLLLWMAFLESGVHATVAGILTAWTIPARSKFDFNLFAEKIEALSQRIHQRRATNDVCTVEHNEEERRGVIQTLLDGIHLVETPLQRLEHGLHVPVAFLVVPIFALANAGIPIHLDQLPAVVTDPITLGIIAGLVLGKLIGIAGISLIAVKLGIGQFPEGTNAKHLVGVGLLGGIGFTMSIFIAELGFKGQTEALLLAKTGVLLASIIAGVAGYLWLKLASKPQ
ncbi:Na+/H+ antiporter NhaA [Thiosocius teredinicola]|uniref:Na+/H+ antiporter NhaA n=1 Tax=Thiosocius teredinicola TaxID=1973002 RepID=UPI0009910ABE